MELSHYFAENLKQARRRAGWTQKELSRKLGYTEKAVSKWECGVGIPPAETLFRLAEILQTSMDALFEFRQDPAFYLGIDGNMSATVFALADDSGHIIRTLRLGPSNPIDIGIENTENLLSEGIREICRDIPCPRISLFAGLSGGDAGTYRTVLTDFFRRFRFSEVGVHNEALNIVAAGLHNDDGVAVIMRSGCVVFSQIGGTLKKYGGFGYLFGDSSSSFGIGRACISAVLNDENGSGPKTALTDLLRERNGCSVTMMIPRLYEKGKSLISTFADPVFDAAAAGDEVAGRILDSSMEEVAGLIGAALRQFPKKPHPIPVVFVGSLAARHESLFPLIRKRLERQDVRFRVYPDEPVLGALFRAGAPLDPETAICFPHDERSSLS